jgi:endonuclease-8
VHLSAARLQQVLAGEVLSQADLRVPRHATVDLRGRAVEEVVARGKHLLLRIAGGTTIHTHFMMDGRFDLYRPGRTLPGPHHEVRAVLATARAVAVGRRLGALDVIATAREHELVGHLGPDLMASDFDAAEATARLLADPARPVGEALLDQRNLAGIGNVYRSELCFIAGVEPATPIGRLRDPAALVALARRVLLANRAHARHVTTGDLRPGRERYVYGRAGLPCLRCGDAIVRRHDGPSGRERVVYLCPSCQPFGGAGDG